MFMHPDLGGRGRLRRVVLARRAAEGDGGERECLVELLAGWMMDACMGGGEECSCTRFGW